MPNAVRHTKIEARIREFAHELADSVRQTTLEALREALRAGSELAARPVAAAREATRAVAVRALTRIASTAPMAAKTGGANVFAANVLAANVVGAKRGGAAGSPTLSLDHYERMAIQRGLHEAGGDVLAAAKLLGLTKSSIYRRMRALGIPRRSPGQRAALTVDAEFVTTKEPVSLERYELMALERALEESGGDILAASKLLKIGKSTMYRKLTAHRRASEPSKAPQKASAKASAKASGARRKKASKRRSPQSSKRRSQRPAKRRSKRA